MNITTVQVYDAWAPAGLAGDTVQINATQILGTADGKADLLTSTGANSVYLQLDAPQVDLPTDDLIGVYPASGSTTSPDEYLPHIALSRYTLPWERAGPAEGKPWLALILFKASDLPSASTPSITTQGTVVKLDQVSLAAGIAQVSPGAATLIGTTQAPPAAPAPVPTGTTLKQVTVAQIQSVDSAGYRQLTDAGTGCGIAPATPVNALYLPNSVWQKIQPNLNDLDLLCHVRMGSNDSAFGIVVGNRLPGLPTQAGVAPEPHTAVLVSLEKRSDLFDAGNKRRPGDTVALLGLYQWTFTPSTGRDFADAIQMIGDMPEGGGVMRFGNLPSPPAAGATAPLTAGFDAVIGADGYLETPIAVSPGGTGSYRGPLRPFTTPARENTFAVHAAPQNFASAPGGTPPDYSYAAAFELGRLMALSDAGMVEDLREVHGVLDLPKNFFGVSVPAPQALLNKTWAGVEDDWYQEPWSGAVGEPAPPATADVSGISQQIAGWTSSIAAGMQGISLQTVAQAAGDINIATVDAATLSLEFSDVVAAAE